MTKITVEYPLAQQISKVILYSLDGEIYTPNFIAEDYLVTVYVPSGFIGKKIVVGLIDKVGNITQVYNRENKRYFILTPLGLQAQEE